MEHLMGRRVSWDGRRTTRGPKNGPRSSKSEVSLGDHGAEEHLSSRLSHLFSQGDTKPAGGSERE